MSSASVVIPSLRGGERLLTLLESLAGEPGLELLVADNGLPAGTAARVRELGGRTIAMGGNLGVGAAVNRAAAAASGELLALLNDDIEIDAGFLGELLAPLERGAAASAGVMLAAESPGVIETAGVVIDRYLGSYDHLQGEPVAVLDRDPAPPLGPCGGAAAWRADVFASLGGFDERFFAYCEDVDLAVRMHLNGIPCALASGARARHAGSATLGYHSLVKACQVGASRGALIAKYGLLRRPGSAAWVLGSELATCAELARRHRSLAPARARLDGYRSARRADRAVTDPPGAGAAGVSLRDGLRRRYVRSLRPAAT